MSNRWENCPYRACLNWQIQQQKREIVALRRSSCKDQSGTAHPGWSDSLDAEPGDTLSFTCSDPSLPTDGTNLVVRAAQSLQTSYGHKYGARLHLEKRIPHEAGLGGGSSDAATTLQLLARLWKVNITDDLLLEIGASIGSDVPFFRHGGTALVTGRGEVVTPLPPVPRQWLVLVVPDLPRLPGKTGQLYSSLKPSHFTDGQITGRMVTAVERNNDISMIYNVFENVAFERFSQLKLYRDHIIKIGARDLHLAGSGPTLFTLIKEKEEAQDLYTRCRHQGLEAYLAETTNTIDRCD